MKLCDFGLTRVCAHDTVFEGVAANKPGKKGYMCPELLAGQPFSGQKADVWSAGVVLFLLLTGMPPVKLASPSDPRFSMICEQQGLSKLLGLWKLQDRVDPQAQDLCQRMLLPQADRLTVYEVLRHPWMADGRS
jgi:serine/threonine-protein kinase HSL1 (negative regulator of Swe1 kinase)